MYASYRRGKLHAGTAQEAARRVEAGGLVDTISGLPGFVAYYMVASPDDTVLTITVYDDQAQADAANDIALQWIRANLADLVAGAPDSMMGEVLLSR